MVAGVLLLVAVALLTYAFYKWATANNDYFQKNNIKYLKPSFLVGSTIGASFKLTAAEMGQFVYNQFTDEAILGFFEFRTPKYIIRHPKVIKQICVKDFDHFEDHQDFTDDKVDDLFGNGLIFMRGEKWRHMRATLSPAFTGSKMRQMFDLVTECADGIVQHYLSESANGKPIHVEMKDLFSRYTNDVIASCAFGIQVNSIADPKNEFYLSGKKLTDFGGAKQIFKILLVKAMPRLAEALNVKLLDETISTNFRSVILDTMEERKKRNIYRPDMINMLMQVRDGSLAHQTEAPTKKGEEVSEGFATVEESDVGKATVNRQWSDDELAAQCFLFFFAGFETASTLLTFTAYELMLNPDIQQRLFEEIAEMNESIGGKHIAYDALQKMKYLDQVVCEALRKWPPFVMVDRKCTKAYQYSDADGLQFAIEQNQGLLMPIYGVQHDAKYFPEPDKFDPERFSDENKDRIVPGSFIPFGMGPRNCIGSRFALMEVKAILYYLLLNFSFGRCDKTQVPLRLKQATIGLTLKDDLHLEFKPRTNSKKVQ